MIKKVYYLIIVIAILVGCKNENSSNKNILDDKTNTLTCEIDFPTNVYTNRKYKGKITFYNKMLDTIAAPRRDTTNFRFIIYKPFKPYIDGDNFEPVYKDSILLESNTVDIELEFDKPGVYNIGGFARDGIMMGYYTKGIRDSVRIIEHEITLFQKVIVKDSM